MPSSTLDELAESYARVSSLNHRALDRFVEVGAQFSRHGIDVMVLKGADLLSRLYGVWGARPMTDIDLLVRESDLDPIDRLLTKSGYAREIDGNPAYRSPDGSLLLDITMGIWYLNSAGIEAVWHRAIHRTIHGLPIRCMNTDDLVLYLTAYAVIHRGACTSLFAEDLALVAQREPVNWESVCAEAVRWNLKVPVYYGLSSARSQQPELVIPHHVLARLAPSTDRERWLLQFLRAVVTATPMEGLGHLLLLLTRPADTRWQWLKRAFFPSSTFLGYRYGHVGQRHPVRTRLTRLLSLGVQAGLLGGRLAIMLCTPSARRLPR